VQELAAVEQMLLRAALMVPAEGVELELAPGPNWEVAAIIGFVHDDMLLSLSSELRNDWHPELTPVGMRGFALEDDYITLTR
jgi:hypothetical protein